MSIPPDLQDRLEHLASLRSQLRQLHGALGAQRPQQRPGANASLLREAAEIRGDLAGLSRSMDARRSALYALQSSREGVDRLADVVLPGGEPVLRLPPQKRLRRSGVRREPHRTSQPSSRIF